MRPLHVIFDVGGLIASSPGYMGRGGLFTTGLALLKAFAQDPRILVTLFAGVPRAQIEAFARTHLASGSYSIHDNIDWRMLLQHRLAQHKVRRTKAKRRWLPWLVGTIRKNFYAAACHLLRVTHAKAFAGVDAWFSPIHPPPSEVAQLDGIRRFVLLHDMIPLVPDVPDDSKCAGSADHWHTHLVRAINTRDHYFANSNYTKRDVLRYVQSVHASQVHVTHLACSGQFAPCGQDMRPLLAKYRIPSGMRYVFSLCTIDPRKNLIRAMKVFIAFIRKHDIQDLVLVLGGDAFTSYADSFNREIAACGPLADRIVRTGYIDAVDLPAFYSHAEWFVYTSQYEGFGLPPLEAMSCGCPVVASNATSLPEVVGDAGILVDWDNDAQHLRAYEAYYFTPALRSEMARRGLERARQFSWGRCAGEMIETIVAVHGHS